jgi:hypothetical protein
LAKSSRPTLGFDRYIPLAWADYALDLAIAGLDQPSLKAWLESQMAGKDAARKTANLLANLWLNSFVETAQLRSQALVLALQLTSQERLILHWGMSLANFPFFRNVAANIGRLIRIQGDFRRVEIRQRMLETYSNQGSIPRLVDRILQTLCDWHILLGIQDGLYSAVTELPIVDPRLTAWLLESALVNQPSLTLPISDLIRLPELFPLSLPATSAAIVRASSSFAISREGSDREVVSLSLFS